MIALTRLYLEKQGRFQLVDVPTNKEEKVIQRYLTRGYRIDHIAHV